VINELSPFFPLLNGKPISGGANTAQEVTLARGILEITLLQEMSREGVYTKKGAYSISSADGACKVENRQKKHMPAARVACARFDRVSVSVCCSLLGTRIQPELSL